MADRAAHITIPRSWFEEKSKQLRTENERLREQIRRNEAELRVIEELWENPMLPLGDDEDAAPPTVNETPTRPSPNDAVVAAVHEHSGKFTAKGLSKHLENRVSSDAKNVRAVIQTAIRRRKDDNTIWEHPKTKRLWPYEHPTSREYRDNREMITETP